MTINDNSWNKNYQKISCKIIERIIYVLSYICKLILLFLQYSKILSMLLRGLRFIIGSEIMKKM